MHEKFLAIDIGASSGRHIIGWMEDGTLQTEEVYRFPNSVRRVDGHLEWDIDSLFANVKQGIKAAFAKYPAIKSLSIDTWAVDYVLLKKEQPLYPVYAYRDGRTQAFWMRCTASSRLRSSTSAPASSFSHSTRCISCMRTKKPGGWRRQTIS